MSKWELKGAEYILLAMFRIYALAIITLSLSISQLSRTRILHITLDVFCCKRTDCHCNIRFGCVSTRIWEKMCVGRCAAWEGQGWTAPSLPPLSSTSKLSVSIHSSFSQRAHYKDTGVTIDQDVANPGTERLAHRFCSTTPVVD